MYVLIPIRCIRMVLIVTFRIYNVIPGRHKRPHPNVYEVLTTDLVNEDRSH
jgi:hypothetical protein